MSAVFDGSGSGYLSRAALTATGTYPFWVGVWTRFNKKHTYGTVYCLWSSERGDLSQGTNGFVFHGCACANAESGGSNHYAASAQAVIPDPYWEHILCEFRSSTDRRVWINNVQEGTEATSHAIDLSAGSPLTRVGIRAGGTQPFIGSIADLTFGTGTLSDADRATLATAGATYSGVTGIAHHYPLVSNGNDAIGTSHFTATSMTWDADTPVVRANPSRADLISWVFKQSTLRAETPTVTTGQASPISAISNLASVEYLDCAFTGSAGAWNTRMWHFIPTVSADHVVFVDGGHQTSAEWATYGLDALVRTLVSEHYAVVLSQMPGFSSQDPAYPYTSGDHDHYWATLSSSVNPLERFLGPHSIALNNIAGRYTHVSMLGLSGGGWLTSVYPAFDARVNHAAIPIRGTIAARRRVGNGDFEQQPAALGYKPESLWRLGAQNVRYHFVHHESDPVIGAKTDSNGGNGAYLNAGTYAAAFLAPIMYELPTTFLEFVEDQGASGHAFTTWTTTNVILPALAESVVPVNKSIAVALA